MQGGGEMTAETGVRHLRRVRVYHPAERAAR